MTILGRLRLAFTSPRLPGVTSKEVASIASRGLKYPLSLTQKEIRTVCASALNQTETKP